MFTFARTVLPLPQPSTVLRATIYATAKTDDIVLCGFKAYVNGQLAGVGPGRGEAPLVGGNSTFKSQVYSTLDVTALVTATRGGKLVLGMQGLGSVGHGGGNKGHGVLLQLQLQMRDGSVASHATDSSWRTFDADNYFHPQDGHGTFYPHKLEFTNAAAEPVGWRDDPGFDDTGRNWSAAIESSKAVDTTGLWPKMARPLQVTQLSTQKAVAVNSSYYFVDFGREFEGGVQLTTQHGVAGDQVTLTCLTLTLTLTLSSKKHV